MKRIIFYVIVIFQTAMISLLVWQTTLIDKYGENIDILLKDNDYFEYTNYEEDIYVEYEINFIEDEKWVGEVEENYHERVYVLLEADKNGFYQVVRASNHKLKETDEQVMWIAKYNYYNPVDKAHQVSYGIETIKNRQLFEGIDEKERLVSTIKVSPWGQKKIVEFNNIENK